MLFTEKDRVVVINRDRNWFGHYGTVTDVPDYSDTIVFVKIDDEDMPFWFFDHELKHDIK